MDGTPVNINSIQKSEKLGFAIVHQEVPLCLNMSIAHNIFLGSAESKKGFLLDEKHMNQKTAELLELFHIQAKPTEILENLSIAEQSIVQIAKAVYFKPRILILDEPTAALTNDQRAIMFDVVRKLVRENHTTVLYVSHRLEEVMELGDRFTVFKDGCFIATQKIADATMDDIITMMVGRQIDKSDWGKTFATDEVLLSVRGLSRRRKFQDVSFDLRRGEILGLAGFVGAGRTEVLSSIFGADRIDSGEIFLKGKKVQITLPIQAIRSGISMIPENRRDDGLITSMSIQQNAQLTLMRQISKYGFVRRSAADALMKAQMEMYKIKAGDPKDGILTPRAKPFGISCGRILKTLSSGS